MDRFGKKVIFIFFCWLCSTLLFAENSTYGILFKSSAELIDHRTSLSLFRDNPLKVNDAFSLSFDLSIWDVRQFGYIVRLINGENQEISLVFVNFRGEDNLYMDLNSSITNKSIQIPLDKKDLTEKIWLKIRLDFDPSEDKIHFFCNNVSYDFTSVGIKNEDKLAMVFGLYGLNLDVPRMAIRNIQIKQKNKLSFTFPLNESEGEKVYDEKGRVWGSAKNPDWIINRHFNWEKEMVFRSECTAGVSFDKENSKILIVNRDSISTYDCQLNIKKDIRISHIPFTIYSGEALYNSNQNICYVYDVKQENEEGDSFAMINMEDYTSQTGKAKLSNSMHHHNAFFVNDTLFMFGGYGNFSYSNKVYKYNQVADHWDTITTSGDRINPRFFSAMGDGRKPSEMLIFGGFGNESGKQELGGKNLYDLFSLDTRTMTLKKMWELKDISELFVPCNNLILDEEHTHFYTLCYPHHLAKTELQLYRFNISDGTYEIVSSKIPVLSEKINSRVYLFYNEKIDEFYAVVREYIDDDTSEVRIYSLLAPPLAVSQLKSYPVHSSIGFFYFYFIVGLILIVCILFIFFRKKKKKEELVDLPEKKVLASEVYIKKNATYTLGDFLVFDNKGTDITYRFSSKLRALFALILFNSKGDEMGISTEKLTVDLWPDREVAEAKNIRGVTINHLRSILMDIDGIELIHKNSRWFFSFDECFYCDYISSIDLMNDLLPEQGKSSKKMDDLLVILKRGTLFSGIQAAWIDVYKRDYEALTENNLLININYHYKKENYKEVVKLSEAFFAVDPLDGEVLVLYIRSLRKLGKTKQSQEVYQNFCKQYLLSMGEEYPNSYAVISS